MKKYLLLLIMTLGIAACQTDEYPTANNQSTEICMTSNINAQTRVYTPTQSTSLLSDRTVYAWADNGSESHFKAWELTSGENGSLNGTVQQFFPKGVAQLPIYAIHGNFTETIKEGTNEFPQSLTHSVKEMQWKINGGTDYEDSDLLYASNKITRNAGEQCLNFYHMLSKIEVVLKAGGDVKEDDLKGMTRVYLMNTRLNVTFNPQKRTATEMESYETRKAMLTVSEDIYDNPIEKILLDNIVTADFGRIEKYAEAIIVPQAVGASGETPFIEVHLQTVNNARLYYKVKNKEFKSGYKYTYHITVLEDRLDIIEIVSDGNNWAAGKNNDVISIVKDTESGYGKDDLKPCDYYYADGTWSDGGYRKYTDGTSSTVNAKPNPDKNLIGLVFYVGNVAKDDAALKTKIGETTEIGKHGLVVALTDAKKSCFRKEIGGYKKVNIWIEEQEETFPYIGITSNRDAVEDNINKILGYNNTMACKAYNIANSSYPVTAVQAVENYTTRPDAGKNSGWYLPSPKELSLLSTGIYTGNIYDINKGEIIIETAMTPLINTKLKSIKDASILGTDDYISSTETIAPKASTNYITNLSDVWMSMGSSEYNVRPVLAF